MATYVPAGTPASPELLDELANGCVRNQDGFGYAIVSNDRTQLITYRSMNAEDMLDHFAKDRDEHTSGPAIVHSRWGTHGEMSIRNVHPFRVGRDRDTVVVHNGVLPMSTWPSKTEWRSDTGVFAKRFLPSWGMNLDSERFQKHVLNFIGAGNKLIILTVNPKFEQHVYLFNEKAGNWSKKTGCWHSNFDYTGAPRTTMSVIQEGNWWNDDDGYVGGGYHGHTIGKAKGIDADVRNGDIVPGRMSSDWLPGREVVRASSVDNFVDNYTRDENGEWTPFRPAKNGVRILTEADVLAAHGYIPTDSWGQDNSDDDNVTSLEPCPTCGSFQDYDPTWKCCEGCYTCGECMMNMATGDCQCYVPAWLSYKYGNRMGG